MHKNLASTTANSSIRDFSHRVVTYLRVSVTDRCNYLCTYCAPSEGWNASPKSELLKFEEIYEIIKVMSWRGVKRVRFTGGEPLLRRHLPELISRVAKLPNIEEIALTTNGHILARYAEALYTAGVRRLNVSLDTFNPHDFKHITRGGDLNRVLLGIKVAQEVGFTDIVINAVLTPGLKQTPASWQKLCEEAWKRNLTPRWIEMMPIGGQSTPELIVRDLHQILTPLYELVPQKTKICSLSDKPRGPAQYFEVTKGKFQGQQIGFISPMSDPHFCSTCNRARLTARGGLRACLADDREIDLKKPVRMGLNGPALFPFIDEAYAGKRPEHLMNKGAPPLAIMTGLGG